MKSHITKPKFFGNNKKRMKSGNNGDIKEDEIQITKIANEFFDLFTNTGNRIPNLEDIKKIFLSDGLIINNSFEEPSIYDLESFIRPRVEILTNGTLTNFKEQETHHKTEICGNIAQRKCNYKKSGELNGKPFEGEGLKLMQFIRACLGFWDKEKMGISA